MNNKNFMINLQFVEYNEFAFTIISNILDWVPHSIFNWRIEKNRYIVTFERNNILMEKYLNTTFYRDCLLKHLSENYEK